MGDLDKDKIGSMVITVDDMRKDAPEWALEALLRMIEDEVVELARVVRQVAEIIKSTNDQTVRLYAEDDSLPLWARRVLLAFVETERGFAWVRAWADVDLLRRCLRVVNTG